MERKEVEPIVPSLQVNSFNNLLSSNEALRGYAVKKAQSPRTGVNDVRQYDLRCEKTGFLHMRKQ